MSSFIAKLIKTSVMVFVVVWSFFTALFSGFLFLVFLGMGIGLATSGSEIGDYNTQPSLEFVAGEHDANHKIVAIPIEGIILGESLDSDGFFDFISDIGITYGYDVKELLLALAQDKSIDGIILEVHSPGGTLFGTQAIIDGVNEFKRATGKPVYAYIGSVGASGGYWVASSGDKIVADAGTTIGSIGVIMGPFKYYDQVMSESGGIFGTSVDTQNGITTEYITAGNHKDLGNPYREMTDEERQVLQRGTDLAYQTFVEFVAESRDMTNQKVIDQIGALAYSEHQAKELGLIDELGSREGAYLLLARDLGIEYNDFMIMRPQTMPGLMQSIFMSFSPKTPSYSAGFSFCNQPSVMAYSGNLSAFCP